MYACTLPELPHEMLQEITSHLISNPTAMACWRLVGRPFRRSAQPAPWTLDWVEIVGSILAGTQFHIQVPRRMIMDKLSGTRATRLLFQAAADNHPGVLRLYQICFTAVDPIKHRAGQVSMDQEIDMLHQLKYVAAMHAATDSYQYLADLRSLTGDDGLKNMQYLYVALGHGHREWVRENLPMDLTTDLSKAVVQFDVFDRAQQRLKFNCPDPLLLLAINGLWDAFRGYRGAAMQPTIHRPFLRRYNEVCLAYGMVDWIVWTLWDYRFESELGHETLQYIYRHGTSTRGLDVLVQKGVNVDFVAGSMFHLQYRSFDIICLFLDWFLAKGKIQLPLPDVVPYSFKEWAATKTLTQ
jgi:hypothetical protein